MGEYVININWSRGGSSNKGNTTPTAFLAGATPTAFLAGAAASATVANTIFKNQADSSGIVETLHEKAHEPQPPLQFFFGRKNWYQDVLETEDIESGEKRTQYVNITTETTLYKRTIAYTAAQALRLANLGFSTHYQYASAIASSTAELNAVNEYQNTMTGIGLATSVVAGTAVGAKIGSIGGGIGAGIGAAIGATVAVANKVINTVNENRILNYKQAINATTSAYQLGVLGDATYGRSRQSIG